MEVRSRKAGDRVSTEDPDGQRSQGRGTLAGKLCLINDNSQYEAQRGSVERSAGAWWPVGYRRDVRDHTPALTRGCKGSQVALESQFHVSRGTSTSPRKMLRPRLSRCHTDRLSMRPGRSACWTGCWGQEVSFSRVRWRPWQGCGTPVDWSWSHYTPFQDGILILG